jgi:hypothetical protein
MLGVGLPKSNVSVRIVLIIGHFNPDWYSG